MWNLLFWACLASGSVRAQTLQVVSPFQTDSVTVLATGPLSISALGVGADGMTTYVEVGAETLAVEISGTVTKTLNSLPISYTATFVEDASKFMIGTTGSGLSESCTFRADGQGACVENFVAAGGASTLTSTYSGPVEPWYTLNAAVATSAPSGFSSSSASISSTGPVISQTTPSSTPSPTASVSSSASGFSWRWTHWMAGVVLPVVLHIL
ncbi:hypothetical protein DFH06DRAFT_1185435 [Mycena polygramma]|nr:hypothetical protein DFH06DRAFT_1185435 [Mycena polygramma]